MKKRTGTTTEESDGNPQTQELWEEADSDAERDEPVKEVASIDFFGTDFEVFGLVRRLSNGDIEIPSFEPPARTDDEIKGFQRKFIWKKSQMDRFIESLLLGYPVPGIFLVQVPKSKRLLVLDGQQRLLTLQAFFSGYLKPGKPFELENVGKQFAGKTIKSLDPEERRALESTFIHATVIKHGDTAASNDAIYQLFERLNTGGTNLHPQEIRVALYNGPLVEFIRTLNQDKDWRVLYGPPSRHLKDHELILRYLAFQERHTLYEKPLKKFLNDFLNDHRDMRGIDAKRSKAVFSSVCRGLSSALGERAFRLVHKQVNAAFVDSMMFGLASRVRAGTKVTDELVLDSAKRLVDNSDFIDLITKATSDEDRVRKRLDLAKLAFAQ